MAWHWGEWEDLAGGWRRRGFYLGSICMAMVMDKPLDSGNHRRRMEIRVRGKDIGSAQLIGTADYAPGLNAVEYENCWKSVQYKVENHYAEEILSMSFRDF